MTKNPTRMKEAEEIIKGKRSDEEIVREKDRQILKMVEESKG